MCSYHVLLSWFLCFVRPWALSFVTEIHTCTFLGVLRRKTLPPRYRALYPMGWFSLVFGIDVDNGHCAAAGPLGTALYLAGRPCVCCLEWLCDPRVWSTTNQAHTVSPWLTGRSRIPSPIWFSHRFPRKQLSSSPFWSKAGWLFIVEGKTVTFDWSKEVTSEMLLKNPSASLLLWNLKIKLDFWLKVFCQCLLGSWDCHLALLGH